MTHQRRRGAKVIFYPQIEVIDSDGVPTLVADMDNPSAPTRASVTPQRSQRAEVPGQQIVNVVRLGVKKMPGVGPWARCYFWDSYWDIEAPPMRRLNVPRQVRHFSIDVRERP